MHTNGKRFTSLEYSLPQTSISKSKSDSNPQEDENKTLHPEQLGDDHVGTSVETPLHPEAFALSEEEKIERIEGHFAQIMKTLGLDLNDDSLAGTPHRVAKMYVKEVFSGLHPDNRPNIRLFDNTYTYRNLLIEKNISFKSHCEHHFVPITGKAHVAYIPQNKVVGLSKLNRLVQYYAKRPQVQERLTRQIGLDLTETLLTEDIAVWIEADHMCVSMRGVEDQHSSTTTSFFSGRFECDQDIKNEFLHAIRK
jgi:GTP cyclohydrolase I